MLITSARRLCFHPSVCLLVYLFVCLSVARISQKVLHQFSRKFVEGLAVSQLNLVEN